MNKINDIVQPRQEVLEDKLQGVIRPYKISDTSRIENNAKKFFNTTYPSNSIKNVLDRVNDKLTFKSNRGGFILQGPRGSGKSHALVALYHTFNEPQTASDWFEAWHIQTKLPEKSKSVILSTRQVEPVLLWEPIFKRAGRDDLLNDIGKYPTTDQIEDLVSEHTFAIFLDEVESWWKTFDGDDVDRERNKFFIENLLNVAGNKDANLFVFITTYGVVEGLEPSFNRTNPYREDMDSSGDKEKVIFHRLFAKPKEKIDEKSVRDVVSEYIESYKSPIQIENIKRYQEECVQSYPFHPQLLSVVGDIYEGERGTGALRGQMNVLSDLVAENYQKTDFLLLSDLNHKAFRGIDRELVNKCEQDMKKRAKNIDYGAEILKVILLHSLKKNPATEHDVLLGVYKSTQGMSLTQLDMSLHNLNGQAFYLHKKNETYQIKKVEALNAMISRERKKISNHDFEEKLSELVKNDLFNNQVYLYEFERKKIPDDARNLKYIIMLQSYDRDGALQKEIESFLQGKMYQNNFVFITPKNGGPLKDENIKTKIKTIRAAESLLYGLEEERTDLTKRINEDSYEAKNYLRNLYGKWVKWGTRPDTHKVSPILIPVQPDLIDIRDKIRTDKDSLKGEILEILKGNERGREVGSLLNDFRKQRKLTLVSSSTTYYSTLKDLHRDELMIIGERAKGYWDSTPHQIEDDWKVIDIEYASRPQTIEEELTPEGIREPGPTGMIELKNKTVIRSREAIGNSPRAILNKYEMIINEESLEAIQRLTVEIDFTGITKRQLLKFLKNLPTKEIEEFIEKIESDVRWSEHEN